MQNYGTSMVGSLVVEKVLTLPTWSAADIGRFLYDSNSENYYLGAPGLNVGTDGWIPLGIVINSVKSYNIDWDIDLSNRYGAVSAKDIPILYSGSVNNVQSAFDDIADILDTIKSGKFLADDSIKCNHLLKTGSDAVTSSCIPLENVKSNFSNSGGSTYITIEDALNELFERTADKINLEDSSRPDIFGSKLGFTSAVTIQDALEALEGYLDTLTASDIPCTYEGCACDTNVQFAIDALYKLHSNITFLDLVDTPAAYDPKLLYLKSDGASGLQWSQIVSNDIYCQYPGTKDGNVQLAIWDLEGRIDGLLDAFNDFKLCAPDICYTPASSKYVFTNVGSALDTILQDFYSNSNKPDATDISCIAMGGPANTNVQLVLAYLDSQLNTLLGTLPCTVGAEDVTYNSACGATDVASTLTYILSFLDYLRTNHGVSYSPFTC